MNTASTVLASKARTSPWMVFDMLPDTVRRSVQRRHNPEFMLGQRRSDKTWICPPQLRAKGEMRDRPKVVVAPAGSAAPDRRR